jgi:multidrug efflux pump subunit AcrB
MMFIALVLGGLYSLPRLPVQNQPDIAFPFVIVSVGYAGVPPSQMETEITRKVEDAVSNIVGIENINSTVSTGSSQTFIEFQFDTELSQAMDDVRDAISRIRPDLPLDATEPNISRATTAGDPVLTFAVSSDKLSDTELSWFVDLNVMRFISGVPGVGQVSRIGGVSREVRVDLDPDRMAALGVTAGDVSGNLLRTQVELPGGETRIGAQEQSVRTLGTITSVQDLAALPIPLGEGKTTCETRPPKCGRWRCSTASRSSAFASSAPGARAPWRWPMARATPCRNCSSAIRTSRSPRSTMSRTSRCAGASASR